MGNSHIRPLLIDIDLEIQSHKITTLLGGSGSGKSTLARALIDLLAPTLKITRGTIYYKEQIVFQKNLKGLRGANIFYIPQDAPSALNPVIKISKQIQEAAERPLLEKKTPGSVFYQQMSDVLFSLNISNPRHILNSYPFQLSVGQKQRCLLAMAVLRNPELLILDEPTASLDEKSKRSFIELIKQLQQQYSQTILWITHDLNFFLNHSHYLYILSAGKIVDRGEPHQLYRSARHPYTRQIIEHLTQAW